MNSICENMKDQIADLVTGILSEAQVQKLQQHLEECATCRDYAQALKNEDALLTKFVSDMDMKSRQERVLQAIDRSCASMPIETLSIRRTIMKYPITKLATAAVIIIVVTLSIHLWDKSTPSAYAFEQTVEAMQGKRSFHIQTYFQNRRKDEFWAQFDEEGKLIRFRQHEGEGPKGTMVTLWEDSVRSQYFPPPWGIHLMTRVDNTGGGLEGLEEFGPETIVQEIHALVDDGKAIMEIQEPSPYADLMTIHVTRTDGKALKQILVVDPDTKFVVRVDDYWGREGEQVFHHGIEVLEYNETMDPRLFEPDFPEDTIIIDQVSQKVGLAQADMSNEEAASETLRQALEAWAAADYVRACKLFGGAPPELLLTERYSNLQPINIISIGRPVLVKNIKPVFRVKCTYEVEHDNQVKTVSPTFTVIAVDSQPGHWYVGFYVMLSTEDTITSKDRTETENNVSRLEANPLDSIVKGIISPGVQVGDYPLDMSKDDVLESLGQPNHIFYGDEKYTLNNLPRKYYMVFSDISFLIIDGSVKEIGVHRPSYKFTNGLGVGDSEHDIIQAFGDDFQLNESEWKDFLT
ncbi:anti-sigma factor family protein, partial [Planctomycetota bacterium]